LIWKRLGHVDSKLTGILTNLIIDKKDSMNTKTGVSAFQVTKFTVFLSIADLRRKTAKIFFLIFMG